MKTAGFDDTQYKKLFGYAEFRQNIFTGSDSEYTVSLQCFFIKITDCVTVCVPREIALAKTSRSPAMRVSKCF